MNTIRILLLAAFALALSAPARSQEGTATQQEMANLAQAMDIFFLDSTYYTTIENLDDVLAVDAEPDYQYINDGEGGALVLNPSEGVPFREELTSQKWKGPYTTGFQSERVEGADGDYDEGTLIDFFGNPYYFYSPLGLIEPKTGDLSLRYYGDDFDRYTIVSHGVDGVPSEDDFIRQFGPGITIPTISSARLQDAPAKSNASLLLVVKGYNLGSSQGSGDILIDGNPAAGVTITDWSPSLVEAEVSQPPSPDVEVSILLDSGSTTRAVSLTDETEPVSVDDWMVY